MSKFTSRQRQVFKHISVSIDAVSNAS